MKSVYDDDQLSMCVLGWEGWGDAWHLFLFSVWSLERKLILKDGKPKVVLLLLAKDSEINMQLGFSDKWILVGH